MQKNDNLDLFLCLKSINLTLSEVLDQLQALKEDIAALKKPEEPEEMPISISKASIQIGLDPKTIWRYIQNAEADPNCLPFKQGIHYICRPSASGKRNQYRIYPKRWIEALNKSKGAN